MGTIRSGVTFRLEVAPGVAFSLVGNVVSVVPAAPTVEGGKMRCVAGHEPLTVKRPAMCPSCGEVDARLLPRVVAGPNGPVLAPVDLLKQVDAEMSARSKQVEVHLMDASTMVEATVREGRTYAVVLAKGVAPGPYVQFASGVEVLARSGLNLVFCFSPRTQAGLWSFSSRGGLLMMEQHVLAEDCQIPLPPDGKSLSQAEARALVSALEKVPRVDVSIVKGDLGARDEMLRTVLADLPLFADASSVQQKEATADLLSAMGVLAQTPARKPRTPRKPKVPAAAKVAE